MTLGPADAFTVKPFEYREARTLMAGLCLAEPVAVTLVRRGYRTVGAARAFLEAADDHDPFAFEAMDEVVARIEAAITGRRRITVHGDYDVDGVCSTAILVATLRALGADCDWLIPRRLDDGYGLTAATVERLAARRTELLITADCGIASVDEVAAAQAAGIEVIVTDHHQPGELLPGCPILHPLLGGYPCAELCATGVAYKLATALRGPAATAPELDLVALATVADLVSLEGENRALVRRGLAEARRIRRPGLRALMRVAGVDPGRFDEGDIAFRLGPRINAAGRLHRADCGVELMLTADDARARQIAAGLERSNRERREVEREVLAAAERQRGELAGGLGEAAGLVLAGAGWHPGVVGIVASRMAERHRRPVVIIGLDGAGRGRGSGRSVAGFDLLEALRACDRHLLRYGGHRAAAGLEIAAASVDAFRVAFAERAAAALPETAAARAEPLDAIVGCESLGLELAEQLGALGPFGRGNPEVRLLVAGARLAEVRPMGEGDRHARFSLASGRRRARGVAFGVDGALASLAPGPLDVSVRLELDEWNGAVEPRVVLGGLYPHPPRRPDEPGPAADPAETIGEQEFWRRAEAELAAPLERAPGVAAQSAPRELIDRPDGSAIATIAALASSGESVLVLCADAVRRRELVEQAAQPARFGGGEPALVSARLPDAYIAAAEARVRAAGGGVVLADWAALERDRGLAARFAQLVVVDPPPFAHLEALARAGAGYLHLLAGPAETDFALRVHAEDWPSRASLAGVYASLRAPDSASGPLAPGIARRALCGAGRSHPLSPEVAARSARVLIELGLAGWHRNGDHRALRVVSSGRADLKRSAAFVAYRDRHEESRRYLSQVRQS